MDQDTPGPPPRGQLPQTGQRWRVAGGRPELCRLTGPWWHRHRLPQLEQSEWVGARWKSHPLNLVELLHCREVGTVAVMGEVVGWVEVPTPPSDGALAPEAPVSSNGTGVKGGWEEVPAPALGGTCIPEVDLSSLVQPQLLVSWLLFSLSTG